MLNLVARLKPVSVSQELCKYQIGNLIRISEHSNLRKNLRICDRGSLDNTVIQIPSVFWKKLRCFLTQIIAFRLWNYLTFRPTETS